MDLSFLTGRRKKLLSKLNTEIYLTGPTPMIIFDIYRIERIPKSPWSGTFLDIVRKRNNYEMLCRLVG